MKTEVILAIDQGTTNTKGLCVGRTGAVAFRTSAPVPMLPAQHDWIEQSPEAIWASVVAVTRECLLWCQDAGMQIAGIAISNQRETATAWNRQTGAAVSSAISWQCRRSTNVCQRLAGHTDTIRSKAGLPLDPLLTATKWRWLLEESSSAAGLRALAEDGHLALGTVDSWLLHRFTGGASHATDHTNASRTGLMNLRTLDWDAELLEIFGIPRNALATILPSSGKAGVCAAGSPLEGVPIVAVIGDSHAALAGHGAADDLAVKATYGTGSSLMARVNALPATSPGLAQTVAWSTPDAVHYALEGNIVMTGAAVRWVGEFLGLPRPIEDTLLLAESVSDADGLVFVPAMAGLGAPYWDAHARGTLRCLGPGHRAAHLARAAVDAIAFQVADVFEAMEHALGVHLPELRADGGGTRNTALMQLQADMVERDVLRFSNEELSALGAAWLGGLTLGWWSSIAEPYAATEAPQKFSPRMPSSTRVILHLRWKEAVHKTLTGEAA